MSRVVEGAKAKIGGLRTWASGHFTESTTIVLVLLIFIYTVLRPMLNRPVQRPDPQERIGIQWIKAPEAAAAYAGNAVCESCHAQEFRNYSGSPHAHTVAEILPGAERAEFASDLTVADDRNNILYSVQKQGGKNIVVAATGSDTQQGVAKWVFGSGVQAYTYLSQDDAGFLQLRISYYPPSSTWNFTPGSGPVTPFHEALGDPYNPAQAASCFGCHSTVLVGTPRRLDFGHSLLNVGCESCHGPCKSHVDSMRGDGVGAQIIPPHNTGPRIMELCGTCHRVPGSNGSASGAPESQLARFPGVALPRSRCFIESDGKMSCITCHDPHVSNKQLGAPSFDLKCMNCHNSAHGAVCSHGDKSGCVNCHMPEQKIGKKLPMEFHNHWIKKLRLDVN